MVAGAPTSRFPGGQGPFSNGHGYTAGKCTTITVNMPTPLSAIFKSNHCSYQQKREHFTNPAHGLPIHVSSDLGPVVTKRRYARRRSSAEYSVGLFICPECPYAFPTRNDMKQHMKRVHLKVGKYQCETCGKHYAHRSNFYDHVAAHTGLKRYVCSVCQKQFIFNHGLKAHFLRFHSKMVGRP